MSALADALVAAQARAVAALAKQYVAEQVSGDDLQIALDSIGLTDPADTAQWIAALDIIRATGASLPRENGATKPPELASERQREWSHDLFGKSSHVPMDSADVARLTKAQASKLIDALQNGTYDAAAWDVPI